MPPMQAPGGVLARLRDRRPYDGHGTLAGATVERARLEDGTAVLVRHDRPCADPVLRSLQDDGRLPRLWASGVLQCLPARVDGAIVGVEPEPDGWAVVLRDETRHLLAPGRRVSRLENRRILAGLAAVHRALRNLHVPRLCPLPVQLAATSPDVVSQLRDDLPGVTEGVLDGWSRFFSAVPDDVVELVAEVHHEPALLARRLRTRRCGVVHGDVRLSGIGLDRDRVVLLGWGSLTTVAPAALDVARYLAADAGRVDCGLDDLLDDARAAYGAEHDEVALRLALLAGLASWGFAMEPGSAPLAWWVERARDAAVLL
jgi:hypothetical protein